jgi:hypothetical protein
MTVKRYTNQGDSYISAIVTYTGDSIGSMGERFSIQRRNSSEQQDMPMNQIAEFLNIETGREGDVNGLVRPTISKEFENEIVKDLPKHLQIEFFFIIIKNIETGREGDVNGLVRPTISKEFENEIVKDLPKHLQIKDGKYVYIGQEDDNWKKYFSTSSYRDSIGIYDEQERLIDLANSNSQTNKLGSFTPNEARGVAQNELVMANLDSQKPILGTFGADSCVAIAVYNPTTHKAMLTHVDALTDINSLKKYLDIIAKDSSEPLQVHLAGGDKSSKKMCANIIKMLKDRGDNTIKSSKLIPLGQSGESLAIDARTGEIFTSFTFKQLDLGNDFDFKSKVIALQISVRPINFVDHDKPKITIDKQPEASPDSPEKSKAVKEESPDKESQGYRQKLIKVSSSEASSKGRSI